MASVLKFVALNYLGAAGTTVDFIGGTTYRVSAWSPAVAARRPGELAGRGPYEDVEEEMTITISGATTLASLAALKSVFDQAARWARGEPVQPVCLHYQPTAASEELRAVVMGGEVELPENLVNAPVVTMIDPVVVRFRRSGLWYGSDVARTDTTTTNPETAVAGTFAALGVAAPIKVELEGLEANKAAVNDSFLLVSSDEVAAGTRIVVMPAEAFAPNLDFTSVSDSANYARGNSVLRFTPSGLPYQDIESLAPAGYTYNSRVKRWGVFVNYRNNSATTSFRVWASLWHYYNAGGTGHIETPALVVPAGASSPRWAFVGSATVPDSLSRVSLHMEASAASGSLDVDDVVLMALDHSDSDIALRFGGASGAISLTTTLIVDPAVLSRLTPAVHIFENNSSLWLTYQGDAHLSMRENAQVVAVTWLTDGYSSSNYWRALDAGGAPQNPLVRVTRTNAYLTPK